MTLEAAGCTDTGAVRSNNEDAFRCCPEENVFVVCDGMGGMAAGEVASRMAADAVVRELCRDGACCLGTESEVEQRMTRAIAGANYEIFERAQREPECFGMGTTLVLACVTPGVAHVAHVGDSRCYLWRRGRLEQVTQDHSLVGEQVRLGRMSVEEAERSPYRHVITRAVGTEPEVVADYQRLPMEQGDVLLLCTDGLTRELHDADIAEVVAEAEDGGDLDAACRELIERANAAGGRDNVTCVLVRG